MVPSYPLPEGFSELDVFALGSCLLVEGLFGFLLNALTVVAFLKIRDLRSASNFLVFSLALADLGICSNATIASFSSFLRYWPYGYEGCQMHGFQGFLTALSSIHFIAAIALDRYLQYCNRTKLQWNHAISIAVFIWMFTAFWSALPLFGWGKYDYEPLKTCCTLDLSRGDWNYASYVFPMATCNMGVQVIIVFFSYKSINKKFKKAGQERFNCSTPLKTLLFCWGPYGTLAFYAAVKNANLLSPKLKMIAPLLAKTSPTFNFFIYALGNENYREGIWQLLTGQRSEHPANENKVK